MSKEIRNGIKKSNMLPSDAAKAYAEKLGVGFYPARIFEDLGWSPGFLLWEELEHWEDVEQLLDCIEYQRIREQMEFVLGMQPEIREMAEGRVSLTFLSPTNVALFSFELERDNEGQWRLAVGSEVLPVLETAKTALEKVERRDASIELTLMGE